MFTIKDIHARLPVSMLKNLPEQIRDECCVLCAKNTFWSRLND